MIIVNRMDDGSAKIEMMSILQMDKPKMGL